MAVGKLNGAVGTFAHIGPEAEERACAKLGLKAAPITSQVISRDRHAAYVAALALVTALLEKIALEVRHLQRTEVRRPRRPFPPDKRAARPCPTSATRSPASRLRLARLVRSNMQAAFENIALWHERDISHSSVERVILPDSTILTDYLLARTTSLVRRMRVYPERMRRNPISPAG